MKKQPGFLTTKRVDNPYAPINLRVMNYDEIEKELPPNEREAQAARCMDCGVPFCHWGCPVSNLIPEWQEKLRKGDWRTAYELLQRTNNFPEFTGRLCPAPCEPSCVLAFNDDGVTIRANELAIIEHAFKSGYVQPQPPKHRTGKKVAVVGSGPAGLACADQLNKLGHTVTLYEADDAVGGYLRYGIPDFKLNKSIIDRRVAILQLEGLSIRLGVKVGVDISVEQLRNENDAICLAIGARKPRDLPIEGRELAGGHFALDYLKQQNKVVAGLPISSHERISAEGKHVVVIGGGDTGSDCVGTANRQGAKSIAQLEILPKPADERPEENPWPLYPKIYKTSSSQKEGCDRHFSITTKKFIAEKGQVKKLLVADVAWEKAEDGRYSMSEVPDSEREINADLVLLAMGFVSVDDNRLLNELDLDVSPRGTIMSDENYHTNVDGIFTAGDAKRGQSLIVWAINEGREAAESIHDFLVRQ